MKSILFSIVLLSLPCVSFAEDNFENDFNSDFQDNISEVKHEGCSNGMCSLNIVKVKNTTSSSANSDNKNTSKEIKNNK